MNPMNARRVLPVSAASASPEGRTACVTMMSGAAFSRPLWRRLERQRNLHLHNPIPHATWVGPSRRCTGRIKARRLRASPLFLPANGTSREDHSGMSLLCAVDLSGPSASAADVAAGLAAKLKLPLHLVHV